MYRKKGKPLTPASVLKKIYSEHQTWYIGATDDGWRITELEVITSIGRAALRQEITPNE